MGTIKKLNCRDLNFSPELSIKRVEKAQLVVKLDVLRNILCFCLYILGVKRSEIAEFLGIPHNTARSILKKILSDGISAFFDRRCKKNVETISPVSTEKKKNVKITMTSEIAIISIENADISIRRKNKLQFKAVVLMLADNKLISKTTAGSLLNVSSSHVGYLCEKLTENDISSLIDQRKGQQQDYVYTPEVKSELILQFAVNASGSGKISGHALASNIQERTRIDLSERSVRHHISKLGLNMISRKMKEMICSQKKTQGNDCGRHA